MGKRFAFPKGIKPWKWKMDKELFQKEKDERQRKEMVEDLFQVIVDTNTDSVDGIVIR